MVTAIWLGVRLEFDMLEIGETTACGIIRLNERYYHFG